MKAADRVRELFGGPAYHKVFAAARERIEQDGERARSTTLRDLSLEERSALADLLGDPRLPEATVRVRLDRLDAALRASPPGLGLRDALVALGGPLVDRAAEARARSEAAERLWSDALAHPTVRGRPELRTWLDELRQLGLLTRAGSDAPNLLDQALDAVARLPDADGVALAVLAARVAGDAHALDPGRPLGNLVLRAAMHLAGWEAAPTRAVERRRLWGEVGVLCDALSSQVLVHALRPGREGWLAEQLEASAEAGEPRRVTLRELSRAPAPAGHRGPVFLCENPVVVERAADRLGSACAALICTEGIPSVAAWRLLLPLARAGATLHFHADFDWGGVRIGNQLHQRLGAGPWRFSAPDYHAAPGGAALTGRRVEASWDGDLAPAMAARGLAVHEEASIDVLIEDLRR